MDPSQAWILQQYRLCFKKEESENQRRIAKHLAGLFGHSALPDIVKYWGIKKWDYVRKAFWPHKIEEIANAIKTLSPQECAKQFPGAFDIQTELYTDYARALGYLGRFKCGRELGSEDVSDVRFYAFQG
jgi:hypothetical protein